jgi:hypothetical protein
VIDSGKSFTPEQAAKIAVKYLQSEEFGKKATEDGEF